MATSTEKMTDIILHRLSPSREECVHATVNFPNPLNEDESVIGQFSIFDGIAFGTATIDGEEREVVAQYPLVGLLNTNQYAKSMKENVIKHLQLPEDHKLTPVDVFHAYAKMRLLEKAN